MTQDPQAMLTEIYVEALLADEELTDLVWEDLDSGKPMTLWPHLPSG